MPPWLEPARAQLAAMIERGQLPQALLIHGLPGTGTRELGLWLASRLLGVPFARLAPLAERAEEQPVAGHPDLLLVQPLADKDTIAIEQVRDLTAFLQLKSHQGGERVVLVWPAEALTRPAANSLLKTLEEPPGGSAIVLAAAAPAQLPPTILSRCHRVRITVPDRAAGLHWLATHDAGADWNALLDFAGGAPLTALALHRRGFAVQMERFAADLERLRRREDSPVAVAHRWTSADPELSLHWLYWRMARNVSAEVGNSALQNAQKQSNMRRLQRRVHEVERLYRNRATALNAELQLAALLQDWYGETGDLA